MAAGTISGSTVIYNGSASSTGKDQCATELRPINHMLDSLEAMAERLEMRTTNVEDRVDPVRLSQAKFGEDGMAVPPTEESRVAARIRRVVERLGRVDERLSLVVDEVEV